MVKNLFFLHIIINKRTRELFIILKKNVYLLTFYHAELPAFGKC
jgi:hypothetical protein